MWINRVIDNLTWCSLGAVGRLVFEIAYDAAVVKWREKSGIVDQP